MWCRAVVGVLLFVGARQAAAQDDVSCDPGDKEVRRLEFSGNNTFRRTELQLGIATTESSWFRRTFRVFGRKFCVDSLTVQRDSARISVFYRDHGFADVKVGYRIMPVSTDAVRVQFAINEGQPILVDSVAYTGLDSVPEKDRVLRGMRVRKGVRFDKFVVEATRDTITRRLRDRGYPIAEVLRSYDTDTTARAARVQYDAVPGPRQWLGAVDVTLFEPRDSAGIGGSHIDLEPGTVRRALGIRAGQLYRETNLEAVKRGLYLTEAFRHVDVSIDSASLTDEKRDSVTIDVNLTEAELHAARVSIGWGNLDCLRAQGTFSNYAFMNRLRRLDLTARLSKIGVGSPLDFAPDLCAGSVRNDPLSDTLNYYVAATLSQAALFGLPFIPSLTMYSERRTEFQAFLRDTPVGVIASLQQGTPGSFPKTYSYQLEYGSTVAQPAFFCAVFNVCEDAARERLERRGRTAVVGWTGTVIRSNNSVNPTSGSALRLEARHASRFVGSSPDIEFNRGVADASFYRPVLDNILAFRLRAGAVVGSRLSFSGGPSFVPPQERMYAGGPNSVRGFRQNELGPAIYVINSLAAIDTIPIPGHDTLAFFRASPDRGRPTVVPTGGDNMVVANTELRLRSFFLPDLVQWAVFVDAGQVWNRGRRGTGIDFARFRVTPGIGARYFSLVGPIRVDVGYNPYARPAGAAYYNPLVEGGFQSTGDLRLICVSPNNSLRVRLGNPDPQNRTPPQQIDRGDCPATYPPARSRTFFSRLTLNLSIGQPF